jgi:hypothetical protein
MRPNREEDEEEEAVVWRRLRTTLAKLVDVVVEIGPAC